MGVKTRVVPARSTYLGQDGRTFAGQMVTYNYLPRFETQWTSSTSHKGPPYLTGGPFDSYLYQSYVTPANVGTITNGFYRHIDGFAPDRMSNATSIPDNYWDSPSNRESHSVQDIGSLGPEAWRQYSPGKPGASAGQFLVELHQLPTIPLTLFRKGIAMGAHRTGKLSSLAKATGDEFLNYQFGWLPFINDLRSMYNTYKTLDNRLKQLARDNGRPVRRGGTVKSVDNSTTLKDSSTYGSYPVSATQNYSGRADRVQTNVDTVHVWFAARFRYWIPDIGTSRWTRRATRELFGADPNISLLWEVLPWSWLFDWFGNVGDTLANLSGDAAENLVADYAYLMATRITGVVYEHTLHLKNAGVPFTAVCSSHALYSHKTRVSASPFGFGLTPGDLSGRQNLILGALGLSRIF